MAEVKTVKEACSPREEVLSGELRDEMFAASLSDVVQGKAHPIYQDPELFFANTYPTERAKSFLKEVFGHLSGTDPSASSFFRLDTPFGGGKTHTLISLYHLATSRLEPHTLRKLGLNPEALFRDGVRVVSVTCDRDLDPANGLEKQGVRIHHLWGELAFQLGGSQGYQLVERSDTQGIAPGPQFLDELIGTTPVLLLIDEPAPYMRMMGKAASQLPAFLKNLAEWVTSSSSRTVLVLTLAWSPQARQPGSEDAFATETQELVETFERTFRELQSVVGRPAKVVTPAQEADIAPILRQRLFQRVDAEVAAAVAETYFESFRQAQQRETSLPLSVVQASYRERLEKSYPFHPALIEVLDGKLATIPNFQRTRGALRLLVRVVRCLWAHKRSDGLLIHPFSLDLEDPDLVDELTGRLDRTSYRSAVTYDIARADGQSHAQVVDRERFPGHPLYTQRVATTLFLHSLPEPPARGLDLDELIAATLTPDSDPAHLQKALDYLLDEAWHLDFEGRRYFFRTEPSLNKIVLDETQATPLHEARAEAERRIKQLWRDAGLKVKCFPNEPADLDEETNGRLVVLHWDTATFSIGDKGVPERVHELWKYAGTQRGYRRFPNTLFFLVADAGRHDDMVNRARRWLALDRLLRDSRKLEEYKLSKEHHQRLEEWRKEANLQVRLAITRAYCHLFYPVGEADSPYKPFAHQKLQIEDQGDTKANHTETVLRILRELSKVKSADDAPLSPALVRRDAFGKDESALSLRTLFERFAERVRLPLLLEPTYLKEIVRLGIRGKEWVYYDEAANLAYDSDQALTDIVVDHQHSVMSAQEAKDRGIPFYRPESPKPQGDKKEEGSRRGISVPPRTVEVEAEPRLALAELAARAKDANWGALGRLQLFWKGEGKDAQARLCAVRTILGQVSSARAAIETSMAIQYQEGAEWTTEFRGPASRYQTLASTLETQAGQAANAYASITLTLEFPAGLEADGPEYADLRETLDLAGLGLAKIVATPFEGSVL